MESRGEPLVECRMPRGMNLRGIRSIERSGLFGLLFSSGLFSFGCCRFSSGLFCLGCDHFFLSRLNNLGLSCGLLGLLCSLLRLRVHGLENELDDRERRVVSLAEASLDDA